MKISNNFKCGQVESSITATLTASVSSTTLLTATSRAGSPVVAATDHYDDNNHDKMAAQLPPYYPHDIFERPPLSQNGGHPLLRLDMTLQRSDLDAAATLASFNGIGHMPVEHIPPMLEHRLPLEDPRSFAFPHPTYWSYDYLYSPTWAAGQPLRELLDIRIPISNVRGNAE